MVFENTFIVGSSIYTVWDTFFNLEKLAPCIPGCEELKAIDEKRYQGTGKQKIGPISIRGNIAATLVEERMPEYVKMLGNGTALGGLGRGSFETTVYLKPTSANETEVSYRTEVRISGKLASFGDRIIRGKAKQAEKEFVQNLNKLFKDLT